MTKKRKPPKKVDSKQIVKNIFSGVYEGTKGGFGAEEDLVTSYNCSLTVQDLKNDFEFFNTIFHVRKIFFFLLKMS